MYIVYEGLNTILPRIRCKVRGESDPKSRRAKLEVLDRIRVPNDVYELRGELFAQHAVAVGFGSSKEEIDLIEAKISVLNEVEGT
jgi:hypothetical protein